MSHPAVRLLRVDEVDAYVALRREMLHLQPTSFSSSPGHDRGEEAVEMRAVLADGVERALFGAFDPGLVGALGLVRSPRPKERHRAGIWGVYVRAEHRGRGLGRALLEAALLHARTLPGLRQVELGVGGQNRAARSLYEAVGFRAWGVQPAALDVDGELLDEIHMQLVL